MQHKAFEQTEHLDEERGFFLKPGTLVGGKYEVLRCLKLGAAGAVELQACVLAIRDNIIPPTINLETPDPECDLDYVPNVARKISVNACLSNSLGFGGHNATLIIKRYQP